MSRLPILTPVTAVGASHELLADLVARHGQGARWSPPWRTATASLIALAMQIYREPAAITDEQFTALRGHGYSNREIADVAGIVALNFLTGAFNLVAGLAPE